MPNRKNDKLIAGVEFQSLRSNKSSSNSSVNYADNLHKNALSNVEIEINETIHRTMYKGEKSCSIT